MKPLGLFAASLLLFPQPSTERASPLSAISLSLPARGTWSRGGLYSEMPPESREELPVEPVEEQSQGVMQIGADPIRIHKDARQLSRRSVQDIARLAGNRGKRVWLLVGDTSQTLPEMRFIDAYLESDVSGVTVRRGRVVHLETAIMNGTAVRWRVRSEDSEYAQVSREGNRWRGSLNDRSIERPFIVNGQFSDQELISLVSFVRSSPEPERTVDRDGTIHMEFLGVDGTLPITVVSRDGSAVVVFLESSTRSGQTLTLTRNRGTWKLVSVTFGIA